MPKAYGWFTHFGWHICFNMLDIGFFVVWFSLNNTKMLSYILFTFLGRFMWPLPLFFHSFLLKQADSFFYEANWKCIQTYWNRAIYIQIMHIYQGNRRSLCNNNKKSQKSFRKPSTYFVRRILLPRLTNNRSIQKYTFRIAFCVKC